MRCCNNPKTWTPPTTRKITQVAVRRRNMVDKRKLWVDGNVHICEIYVMAYVIFSFALPCHPYNINRCHCVVWMLWAIKSKTLSVLLQHSNSTHMNTPKKNDLRTQELGTSKEHMYAAKFLRAKLAAGCFRIRAFGGKEEIPLVWTSGFLTFKIFYNPEEDIKHWRKGKTKKA